LELAPLDREHRGRVRADDVESDLVEGLGGRGVDLSRHDGRAGLDLGQTDLVEPRRRPAAEEAEVVRDADQLERERPEPARRGAEREPALHRLERVPGDPEREAGEPRVLLDGAGAEADDGVEARTDRAPAQGNLRKGALDAR